MCSIRTDRSLRHDHHKGAVKNERETTSKDEALTRSQLAQIGASNHYPTLTVKTTSPEKRI